MAQRLLSAQIPAIVYNRTAEKLESLRETSAAIASSAEEAIEASECIILMLADTKAIQTVLLSDSAKPLLRNRTIIQMGTISPAQSQAICDEVVALGGEYLEAPVLGSIPEAAAGKLLVMVGASDEQFQKRSPLLQHFGPEPILVGPVGTAAALKLALNQLIASLSAAFALSLGLVQHRGVEVETFMKILRQSALYAPTFDKKLQRQLDGNYANPNFPIKHLLKDTNLFIDEALSAGLNVSSLEGVRQLLEIAQQMGFSESDYSALFSAVNPHERS